MLSRMTDTPSPSVTGTSSQSQSGSGSPSETSNYTRAIIGNNPSSASKEFPIEGAVFFAFASIPIAAIAGYVGYITICRRRRSKRQHH